MSSQPDRNLPRDPWIRLHQDDDVVVLRQPLGAGARFRCEGREIVLTHKVGAGHKVAIRRVGVDESVRKYGQVIGFARSKLEPGDWVHSHNLEARDFDRLSSVAPGQVEPWDPVSPGTEPSFQGFARSGGGVGTRNYVGILTTVNCSASAARAVRERFPDPDVRARFPNVDGVVAFTFKGGCGMPTGEPQRLLQRVLNGLVRHPNFGGVIVLGLGCEVNQLRELREAGGWTGAAGEGIAAFEVQASGGLRRTVEAAARAVEALLPVANRSVRTPQSVRELKLALNCGGSDAHSGITANPALGWASDQLVRCGGTSVLAETTEIYGAEHLLTRRAVHSEVAAKLARRIHWWEDHVRRHGAAIDNNPSPGNKAGGLTTIYEKSLGAVAKGGQAPLMEVYEYAEPVRSRGLCFMDTPGLDPVSMTGLVSGGCNIAVFTTGRGSVYGCKPSPCVKIATHTALFNWMSEDMDLNAGTILDGDESVEEVGDRIFREIVEVASGRRTKSELAGVGDEEFAPWILGPTL